eukprot:7739412-Pyramimonas_sp.AAC.1
MAPPPDPSWTAGNLAGFKGVRNGRVLNADLGTLFSVGLHSCQYLTNSLKVASSVVCPSSRLCADGLPPETAGPPEG